MAAAELMSISGAGLHESPFTIAQTWRQAAHGMKTSTDGDADGRDGADELIRDKQG